jgi:hypothetical protein
VILVFTKYDQFRHEIAMKLEEAGHNPDDTALVNAEMERIFDDEYLTNVKGVKGCDFPPYVRLKSEDTIYPLVFTTCL